MNCRSQITAKKFKEASKTLIQIKVSVHLQITNIPHPHRNHKHTGNWLSMQLSMCTSTYCRFANAYTCHSAHSTQSPSAHINIRVCIRLAAEHHPISFNGRPAFRNGYSRAQTMP